MENTFEQGPIRPPSEAQSLLLRVTRNCPWNRCAFCTSYRGKGFSLRSLAEIKADIKAMKRIAVALGALSWQLGEGGRITERVVAAVYQDANTDDAQRSLAAWLYFGGTSVFLQDANSLILKTADLAEVITYLKKTFPTISRITSYCRSHTAARKSLADLERLQEAGLSRVHIGMESGSDAVLKFIDKGADAATHIAGGRNIVAAGLSLCEYIIPGLGGKRWSQEHALATAQVLNAIKPDFIRLRSLHIVNGTPLAEARHAGEFEPLDEEEVVREIRLLIENLTTEGATIVSDHILNLLEEVEGTLPQDKAKMLGVIDDFLALPLRERLIFCLGRRHGCYRRLSDLQEPTSFALLGAQIDALLENPQEMPAQLELLKHGFV